MLFKNAQVYCLKDVVNPLDLRRALDARPLLALGDITTKSMGWVHARERDDGSCDRVHGVNSLLLIAMGENEKVLPPPVIRENVRQRAAVYMASQGHKPGRKALREMKDAALLELLPKAFTKRRTTLALIDGERELLYIDSASPTRAEAFVLFLRLTLEEAELKMPMRPAEMKEHIPLRMTQWVRHRELPGALSLDAGANLRSADPGHPTVRYINHHVEGEEVRTLIDEGMVVTRLALNHADELFFVLAPDPLHIKGIQEPPAPEVAEAPGSPAPDPDADFNAAMILFADKLGRLMTGLQFVLGGFVEWKVEE